MAENSFDIVSKVDLQEVSNAIQQALKEIHQRYDLKDSKSNIELEGKDALILTSADDYKLKAVTDVLQSKLVKRGVPLKALDFGKIEPAASTGPGIASRGHAKPTRKNAGMLKAMNRSIGVSAFLNRAPTAWPSRLVARMKGTASTNNSSGRPSVGKPYIRGNTIK